MDNRSTECSFAILLLGFFLFILSVPAEAQAFGFKDPELSTEESSQIVKILDTFSSGCSLTRGPSADAISVVRGLSSTIRASLESPNCKSLSGVATSLDSSAMQAQSLIPDVNNSYINELEQQINSLEKQKQEIIILLTQTTDLTELASLRAQLYSIRIELAGTLSSAHDTALNDQQMRRALALKSLLNSTNQAVNQILANESCWVGQPGILQQVTGAGTILSANAALMTPASQTAVLLTSGMSILSTLVDFFKRLSVAKKVAQFDLAIGSTALTCALEKMNDVYCSAQDTLNAIQKVGGKIHDPKADPIWHGLGLLDKEIPVLLAWLQKVKSGGSANTTEDAEKRADIELREVKLNNSKILFEGFARDAQLRYDMTGSPDQKFSILRSMIRNYANRVCITGSGNLDTQNQICTVKAFDYTFYFLLGLDSSEYQILMKNYPNMGFGSVDLALLAGLGINKPINLDVTKEKFQSLFNEAKEQLDIEKKLSLGQDLALIFDEALKRDYKISNPVTAESAIESLIQFLNSQEHRQGPQKNLREQVSTALTQILEQIRAVAAQTTSPEEARAEIFIIADLKIGTSFLGDRLERIVRTDLEGLVYDSDKIDDVTRLPFLAAKDAVTELRRYYQVSSLIELQESATNAQLLMNKTLDPFITLFANPMQRAFDEFDSIAKRVGGDGAARAIALKTKMCFYFLGSLRTQEFFLKECDGLIAKSVIGLETPPFRRDLFKQPVEQRACLYRNFIMKNRIEERDRRTQQFPEFEKLLLKLSPH